MWRPSNVLPSAVRVALLLLAHASHVWGATSHALPMLFRLIYRGGVCCVDRVHTWLCLIWLLRLCSFLRRRTCNTHSTYVAAVSASIVSFQFNLYANVAIRRPSTKCLRWLLRLCPNPVRTDMYCSLQQVAVVFVSAVTVAMLSNSFRYSVSLVVLIIDLADSTADQF